MGPFGIKQIADALGLSVPQIQQWIARGYLEPTGEEGSGRRGRQWTFEDAVRVQICRQVVGSRIRTAEYRDAIEAAVAALDDCLLVIVAPGHIAGHYGMQGHKVLYFQKDGAVTWRIATAAEVSDLVLAKHGFRQLTVIEISALVAETKSAFEFYEQADDHGTILIPPEEAQD